MVKLYASLLALTLATSLSLATSDQRERHPYYTHGYDNDGDLLERDLDVEFSGREYLRDASVDLEARQPGFWGAVGGAFKDVGKVAEEGIHVAKKVAGNKIVQTAAEAAIPGEGEAMMAGKVAGKLLNSNKAVQASRKVDKGMKIAKKVEKGAKKVDKVSKKVNNLQSASSQNSKNSKNSAHQTPNQLVFRVNGQVLDFKGAASHRRHRRDLEDDEELLRRDLDVEELFGREYDDFLAERDYFDDLEIYH